MLDNNVSDKPVVDPFDYVRKELARPEETLQQKLTDARILVAGVKELEDLVKCANALSVAHRAAGRFMRSPCKDAVLANTQLALEAIARDTVKARADFASFVAERDQNK
jgi:hypothetical protein